MTMNNFWAYFIIGYCVIGIGVCIYTGIKMLMFVWTTREKRGEYDN